MKFNSKLGEIKPSASMKIGLGVNNLDYLNLAIGIPDIKTPLSVKNILSEITKDDHYSYIPTRGTQKALSNLIEVVLDNDKGITKENISLISGAKFGIYLSLKTVTNPGDSVVLIEPYWLSYPDICKILGLNIIIWKPTVENGNLNYNFDELENLISINSPVGIIVNQPNNPAGTVFRNSEITKITQLFRKNDGFVLFDEVYKDFTFYDEFNYDFDYSTIIRVGSLSKSLSLTGLRSGYIVSNSSFISALTMFNQHLSTCTNSLTNALIEKISKTIFDDHVKSLKKLYRERFELLKTELSNTKLNLINSKGTFYALVDFSYYFKNGEEAVDFLRDELKILTTSGSHYGETFRSYVRICLSVNETYLNDFIERLTKKLVKKNENF